MKKLNLKDYPKCPKEFKAIYSLIDDDELYKGCGNSLLVINQKEKIKHIFYIDNFLNRKDFLKGWNEAVKKDNFDFKNDEIFYGMLSCRDFLLKKKFKDISEVLRVLEESYCEENGINCIKINIEEEV